MEFDIKALVFLACPQCKGDLNYTLNPEGLICKPCGLLYPINDGIPVMLVEEAKKIEAKNSE